MAAYISGLLFSALPYIGHIDYTYFLQGELHLDDAELFHDRPPLELVIQKFRSAKMTAYISGLFFTLLFIFIWPGSMLSVEVLDLSGFSTWTIISRAWAILAAAFIIFVPLMQEVCFTSLYHTSMS